MAETVGSRSRKRFLVLFRIIEKDQELIKKMLKVILNPFKNCNP